MTVKTKIEELGPWFHNLHLPDGTQTAPEHWLGDFPAFKWRELAPHLPEDLGGWRVLDIGCNAGFYTFELAKRGASVLGIDMNPRYLAQARWAAQQMGLEHQVEFARMQVYDLASLSGDFDLVLFMGVFYHLRYPLLGLDIVAQKVKRLLVFQTLTMPGSEVVKETYDRAINDRQDFHAPGWPKMAFIEHRFAGDPTNWWAANQAGVEAMLRSSGLRVIGYPDRETFLCEPDPDHPSCVQTWNAEELVAATGRRPGITRILPFQHCQVQLSPGLTQTFFHDGTHVVAAPEENEEYRGKAARFGYGDDVAAMSREHEVLHTFLAEALGYGSSPTLWAVAHGQQGGVAPVWEQEDEESCVLAFQSYLNGGPVSPELERFTQHGLDLKTLHQEATRLLRESK